MQLYTDIFKKLVEIIKKGIEIYNLFRNKKQFELKKVEKKNTASEQKEVEQKVTKKDIDKLNEELGWK